MADVSKIKLSDNTEYNIKDTVARNNVTQLDENKLDKTSLKNESSTANDEGYSANYLNDKLVSVGATAPTNGERVWFSKSNNKFEGIYVDNENIDSIQEINQDLTPNTTYTNSATAKFFKSRKVVDCFLLIDLKAQSSAAAYWKLAEGLRFKPKTERFEYGRLLQSNGAYTGTAFMLQIKTNGDMYLKSSSGYQNNYKIYLNMTYLTDDV